MRQLCRLFCGGATCIAWVPILAAIRVGLSACTCQSAIGFWAWTQQVVGLSGRQCTLLEGRLSASIVASTASGHHASGVPLFACRWGPNAVFRFPLEGGTGAIWKGVSKLLPQDKQVGPASCHCCVLLLSSTDVTHACVSCQFLPASARCSFA